MAVQRKQQKIMGIPEISGQMMHPAVQSALAAVTNTPQFQQLVAQHAAALGMAQPQSAAASLGIGSPSQGGPGAAYGGQPSVQMRPMRDVRELCLGFRQTGIASGASFNVVSRPQVLFRAERLVIPDSPAWPGQTTATQADSFDVSDIKIGNRSQLVEATTLPGRAFAENAVGVRLSMDSASIAQDIVVAVVNNDVASGTFRGIMFGTSSF